MKALLPYINKGVKFTVEAGSTEPNNPSGTVRITAATSAHKATMVVTNELLEDEDFISIGLIPFLIEKLHL